MSTFLRRLWHLLNRRRFERELMTEMRDHREALDDPARFGDPYRLLEQSRDSWGWNWLDDAAQDFRQGVRALWRSPGFALTGTLILAFGIGLNLTFYQITSVALIRPRPVRSPDTLVALYHHAPTFQSPGWPYAMADAISREHTGLASVLMQSGAQVHWGDTRLVDAQFVSTNWFEELGYGAAFGRVFVPRLDDQMEGPPPVVLSHAFWRRELQSDPDVVGRTAYVDRRPVTIIGVARADFPEIELDDTVVWIPIVHRDYFYPETDFLRTWSALNTQVLGRLRPGVSMTDARESLRAVMAAFAQARPRDVAEGEWIELISGRDNFLPQRMRNQIWTVLSLAGGLMLLVLAVAAANLGNLVLARVSGRVRELGIRVALGARRSRITRQLLTETVPLGILGSATAMIVSWWATQFIATVAGLTEYLRFAPDGRTVLAAVVLLLIALVSVAALPAWKIGQQDLTLAVRDGGQQVSMRLDRTWLRRLLLGAQVTFSCVIIAIAAMTANTVRRVVTANLGFEYEQVARVWVPLGRWGIGGDAARAYWHAVKERVGAHPEAGAASMVVAPPLGGTVTSTRYNDAPSLSVVSQRVEPDYFAVMQIPLVSGRTFSPADHAQGTAIVSSRLAREMYGTLDVVGRGFPRAAPERIIVGVAADAHTIVVTATDVAEMYAPLAAEDYENAQLLVRARTEAALLLPLLRDAAAADPRVIATAQLVRDDFARRTRPARLVSTIIAGVGSMTLLLSCLGIFGVVSYSVAARRKEIGIHLALGAPRLAVLRLMTRRVLIPVVLGTAFGLVAAAPAGMVLSGEPLYLSPLEPGAYAVALGALLITSTVAAIWPALRSLRADPVRALHHQ
jgi:putative ABC transport system permease protein